MKTLVALLALVALFGFIGLFGAALAIGPCAGSHRTHRARPGAAETRAEAIKALVDGLRHGFAADGPPAGQAGARAVLLYEEPGDPPRPEATRLGGGRWEVRARDCRTGREWRFLLLESDGETVVILRQ